MASDKGPLATETPPIPPPATLAISVASPSEAVAALDAGRKSLKRTRETTPTAPGQTDIANLSALQAATASPTKSARLNLAPRRSPTPFTAAAALEEERERRRREEAQELEFSGTSDNPSHQALAAHSGGALAMSRSTDAPVAAMEPTKPPAAVTIPPNNTSRMDVKANTSPQSATSGASLAGAPVMESPTPMDMDPKNDVSHQPLSPQDKLQPASLSYPGSLQVGAGMPAPPARGMSFPTPSSGQTSPTSSSNKKHKCPYCDTEFTRHHNLKSHLLTHSQEKPYVCQDCQMRFRRLHDLKRHSKLHTGEKPHICPKCERKFARGDALARHSKGAGGCAGRRSSMGSFADDDMEGVSMTEGDDSAMAYDEDMTEEDRRRLSLPSIKAQHVAGAGTEGYSPHSRTYPPAGARANTTGGLYPPNVDRVASSTTTSPSGHTPTTSISSMPHSATTNASIYSQSGMTESPKPLSPGVPGHEAPGINRQRSPSVTQQFQQQHFGRRATTDRSTPPNLALPPHNATKLPALSGFTAPDTRFAPGQAGGAAPGGAHSRTSSTQGGSGDNSSNLFAQGDQGVWNYIQTLEEKIKQLSPLPEKLATMEKTNGSLQAQVGALTAELQIVSQDMNLLKQQLEILRKASAPP